MEREVKIGSLYRHFKGSLYRVICICKDVDDLSLKVVYRNEKTSETWVRDMDEFLSLVDKKKYPYVREKYRFTLVD